jgi:hypothetical protein
MCATGPVAWRQHNLSIVALTTNYPPYLPVIKPIHGSGILKVRNMQLKYFNTSFKEMIVSYKLIRLAQKADKYNSTKI